ncbi:hypothetical protein BJY01DRAFT_252315 [Aspergillus pseudoustus]|uniref:FAD-binding domain-containing protein n=1 Tax=Aspergillus pseudoustus TaxID=1810923 RepID=A0ABR4J7Z3_9EURO
MDNKDDRYETTDVVICGCGPTGAMLSGYLSRMSVKHVVLEKEGGITTDPRGIALDEDGIRLLQGIGIYKSVYSEIGTCMQLFKFIGGTQKDLHRDAFLEMDYATTEGGTGHVGFICHKQPILEQHLRATMASDFCQLRSQCTVMEISQDLQWTYCRYRDQDGQVHALRSRFFVGADGKTGFTRKNYLEPLGIRMEPAHNAFYDETWVALNWQIDLPTQKSHPDFALWSLGYSPQDVYDLFFPANFRFICNPLRPAVCGRFGLPSDRLWRFEFVVRPGEDPDEMAASEKTMEIISPYITHKGKGFGLPQDVQYPEDCISVLRSRPFRFAARDCNRWSHGRVILCGDAAHVFPPFGGQGIASGFRDAASLAWRLSFLTRRPPHEQANPPHRHESVLEGWYRERKQQLSASLASTIENGRFVTEANPLRIFLRTCYLFVMNLVPRWRRELRLGRRKEGLIRYRYEEAQDGDQHHHGPLAMPFMPELNGGLCLPQVYCKPVVAVGADRARGGEREREGARVFFTDDVIFDVRKTGLFQLLVCLENISELDDARETLSSVNDVVVDAGGTEDEICFDEATYLIQDDRDVSKLQCDKDLNSAATDGSMRDLLAPVLPPPVYQLASAEEFAGSPLCEGRPTPQGYDPHYLGKALGRGLQYVIVRPDRFIFAACRNSDELRTAVAAVVGYLRG